MQLVGEKLQCVGDEGLVVLEHASMSGVGVDLQLGVGKSARHVGGVGAVDHEVVVAVGDEDGLGDDERSSGSLWPACRMALIWAMRAWFEIFLSRS